MIAMKKLRIFIALVLLAPLMTAGQGEQQAVEKINFLDYQINLEPAIRGSDDKWEAKLEVFHKGKLIETIAAFYSMATTRAEGIQMAFLI